MSAISKELYQSYDSVKDARQKSMLDFIMLEHQLNVQQNMERKTIQLNADHLTDKEPIHQSPKETSPKKPSAFPSPYEKKQMSKGLKGKVIKLKNKGIKNKLFQVTKNKELEDQVYNSIPVALNKYSWQQ